LLHHSDSDADAHTINSQQHDPFASSKVCTLPKTTTFRILFCVEWEINKERAVVAAS
jgi:hypothetical protein